MQREPNSRLVYSTGGDQKDVSAEEKKAATPLLRGGIRLRLDRRASGRLVTLVAGVPGAEVERVRLLKQLKTACGAGGTLKDGVVELQGDHRDRVESVLRTLGLASKRAGG